MEKLITCGAKIKNEVDKNYKEAIKNEEFKSVVTKLKLDEKTIKKNITKIEENICEIKNCKKCKGLYECKNLVSGHVMYPIKNETNLQFGYKECKYLKKSKELMEEKNNSGKEILNARMKDIDISDKKRIKLIKWLKDFYDNYDKYKVCKGLYLHGSFGSGKTYLISALFNELEIKKHITKEIIYFPDLLRELKEDFSFTSKKLSYLENVDLLLIDDIGAEKVTQWGRDEILGTLLQSRMNNKMTTFFTSNLNIEELERHLSLTKDSEDTVKSRRIIERVKQLTTDMELISENKRN